MAENCGSFPSSNIIENNQYAMGTASRPAPTAEIHLFKRGAQSAERSRRKRWTGMDCPKSVYAARPRKAVALGPREGKGSPYILEMKTYRYRGHSIVGNPAKYRNARGSAADARESMIRSTPSARRLVARGPSSRRTSSKPMTREVRQVHQSRPPNSPTESPEPALEELYTDILKVMTQNPDARAVPHHGGGQALQKWHVKEGDGLVKAGDILAEIETDKADDGV